MLPGLRAAVPGLRAAVPGFRAAVPGFRAAVPGLRACVCPSSVLRGLPLSHSRFRSSVTRPQSHSCTVDPGLTEQFVFVDCVDQKQDCDPELDLIPDLTDLVPKHRDPTSPPAHRRRRGLEQQLQTLKTLIQVQDKDRDQIQFDDVSLSSRPARTRQSHTRPDPEVDPELSFSSVPCSGCGALLQAIDPVVPGFLPPHHLKTLLNPDLQSPDETKADSETRPPSDRTLCQRCHLLTHQRQLLEVQLDQEHFKQIISSRLRSTRALVLLVVDLVDLPNSIIPSLQDLIGTNKQVAVVGTKLDLIPVQTLADHGIVKRRLLDYIRTLTCFEPVHVALVSAKTGFGIEDLVSGLQRVWRHKGDVVLVGSTNAGKSTLFNALLDSDYNRTSGSNRATESPWPGTTLNLLKFPILNPTPARLQRRLHRLKEEAQALQTPAESATESPGRDRAGQGHSRPAYVSGHVGRTFQMSSRAVEIQFDPDVLAFGETEDGLMTKPVAEKVQKELPPHELKDAHWFYDTPGIIKDHDMLGLLTEEEVRAVVPVQALVPRTFVLKPGSALFVGGLLRIDFISGPQSVWFSVLVSGLVPLHLTTVERAESVYEKHAGGRLLGVPTGGAERMKTFPKLVPMDVQVEGKTQEEASLDINISSTGWVAVTPPLGDVVQLRVWSPEGGGVSVRTPSLLPRVVMLRGARIKKSSAYKVRKPPPATPLSLSGQSGASKARK